MYNSMYEYKPLASREITHVEIFFCKDCKQQIGAWGCGMGCKWNIEQDARPIETHYWKITKELLVISVTDYFAEEE